MDLALLQDTIMITDGNVHVIYNLDKIEDDFIYNFQGCNVHVYDKNLETAATYTCADDIAITKQDQEFNNPFKIEIQKQQDQLIRHT